MKAFLEEYGLLMVVGLIILALIVIAIVVKTTAGTHINDLVNDFFTQANTEGNANL